MRVVALKDFPYSRDGADIRTVPAAEEFDCRDDLVDGLKSEGFVRDIEPTSGAEANTAEPPSIDELKAQATAAASVADAAEAAASAARASVGQVQSAKKPKAEAAAADLEAKALEARTAADKAAAAVVAAEAPAS